MKARSTGRRIGTATAAALLTLCAGSGAVPASANGAATPVAFTSVLPPILQRLQSSGGGFGFVVETPPVSDTNTSTEPMRTRWVVGAEPLTVWACFAGGTVTVGRDACPAVP